MKVFNHNRTSSCTVGVSQEHFGKVAVYDDRITIEYRCKALDEFLDELIADTTYRSDINAEPDSILIMLVPNIQRRRFDLMLYIRIQDGSDTVMKGFVTDAEIEERRLVVDTILAHRESISDDIYRYYTNEYEPWRV